MFQLHIVIIATRFCVVSNPPRPTIEPEMAQLQGENTVLSCPSDTQRLSVGCKLLMAQLISYGEATESFHNQHAGPCSHVLHQQLAIAGVAGLDVIKASTLGHQQGGRGCTQIKAFTKTRYFTCKLLLQRRLHICTVNSNVLTTRTTQLSKHHIESIRSGVGQH